MLWWSGITEVTLGSDLKYIFAVLFSIAVAAVFATNVVLCQGSPEIRTGVYRGHVVTYEIIDGLAVWDGDIILGTPEELDEPSVFAGPNKALDTRQKSIIGGGKQQGKKRKTSGPVASFLTSSIPNSPTRMFPTRSRIGTKTRSSAWWKERISRTGFASCRMRSAYVELS